MREKTETIEKKSDLQTLAVKSKQDFNAMKSNLKKLEGKIESQKEKNKELLSLMPMIEHRCINTKKEFETLSAEKNALESDLSRLVKRKEEKKHRMRKVLQLELELKKRTEENEEIKAYIQRLEEMKRIKSPQEKEKDLRRLKDHIASIEEDFDV